MKIKELNENLKTATSVGNLAVTTANKSGNKFFLKRRNQDTNEDDAIATIRRENKRGWRFNPTDKWKEHKLPHMGHAYDKKLNRKGKKNIEQNIEDTLKDLGITFDSVKREEAEES